MTTFGTPHRASLGATIIAIVLGGLTLIGGGCAGPSGQRFASPDEAGAALAAALSPYDQAKLREVLGPGSEDVISSGDSVADGQAGARFAEAFRDHHESTTNEDGSVTLVVGKDRWPMPIPLVPDGRSWVFDTDTGWQEIVDRRVGRNELSAIEVCRAIVDAEHDYYGMDPDGDAVHTYAARFRSQPGRRDGLFWPQVEGQPQSPLGQLAAQAAGEGYTPGNPDERQAYHGYYYRLITAQGPDAPGGARDYMVGGRLTGGFGVVAWPATYGNSGIMTFTVGENGVVFQKDLGEDTEEAAVSMQLFDPGPGWDVVP